MGRHLGQLSDATQRHRGRVAFATPDRTAGRPPMVQFVVIFLRLGLCRNNSSSLLVGSHVVYFSPMPVDARRKHARVRNEVLPRLREQQVVLAGRPVTYLAISRLSSAPLWQSAPCLCRICSPDTRNNIFRRITGLLLEAGVKGRRERLKNRHKRKMYVHFFLTPLNRSSTKL